MTRSNAIAPRALAPLLAIIAAGCVSAAPLPPPFIIPEPVAAPLRDVTVEDVVRVREIAALRMAPDGHRYAVLVRQADPASNAYRSAWFAGDTRDGSLRLLGDAGPARPRVMHTGHMPGMLDASEGRWSPDGAWLAYTRRGDDTVQLWRVHARGGRPEPLTHNAADVRDFAWSADGRALYYSAGTPRDALRARDELAARQGYRYDEDFWQFTDLLGVQLIRAPSAEVSVWRVDPRRRDERPATPAGRTEFEALIAARGVREASGDADAAATVARLPDDRLRLCASAANRRLVCVRDNALTPDHVVVIDLASGQIDTLADVNPEFRGLRRARVERFEWDTPHFEWNETGGALAALYPSRAYGYVIYPPDFDPARQYPVFIDPYVASGFAPLGAEHALQAYAASGIVVLRLALPLPGDRHAHGVGMKQLYSAELDFPHLTMLMESTLRGLDTIAARGFIDLQRVGIGGVSHGTFVPLYLLQKHDRLAAISISSPHWGPTQYYWSTRKARDVMASFPQLADDDWARRPDDDAGREFWRRIDIADHVDAIEAPVLMQLAAHETYALLRLIRHLDDAGLPYDAYVFPQETHIKWQPAHRLAIQQRNLDWFRFWLQEYEHEAPDKREQYERWHGLRRLQCRNPRALTKCAGAAAEAPAAALRQ